jgi:hypothetical protein
VIIELNGRVFTTAPWWLEVVFTVTCLLAALVHSYSLTKRGPLLRRWDNLRRGVPLLGFGSCSTA